ncbi:MAG: signal peptidase II [Campylobacterota bacterium]|nr:signal peptidase II [Campylobacterota bacterium]
MAKNILALLLALIGVFIVDQNIKSIFLDGYRYYGEVIDLILVYNKGVAFSMLSFLDEWLKWLQLLIIAGVLAYVIRLNQSCYSVPVGILVGAGLSNVYDRFIHGGVVDYVYWHYKFDFAVFNFADVMIDVSVVWLLILSFKPKLCGTKAQ